MTDEAQSLEKVGSKPAPSRGIGVDCYQCTPRYTFVLHLIVFPGFSSARFTPLHPKETVRNIFLGRPFSLEFYKSWSDKIALIDEALLLGDGNAILAVSLTFSIFIKNLLFV